MPAVSPAASSAVYHPPLMPAVPPTLERPNLGGDYFAPTKAGSNKNLTRALTRTVAQKHKDIADHAFFTSLNDQTLSRSAYVRYLRDRLAICAALEKALRSSADEIGPLAGMHFDRRPAVVDDLHALGVRTKSGTMVVFPPMHPSPAARKLTHRIKKATPLQALAHAWVEYMGMMFGGQGMRPKLKELFGTAQFVTFESSVPALRKSYEEMLNGLDARPWEVSEMCDEALEAFDLHRAVLDQNLEPVIDTDTDTDTESEPEMAQASLWDTWRSAFAWVPRLFETR